MIQRRFLTSSLLASACLGVAPAWAARPTRSRTTRASDYGSFLAAVRQEALSKGISPQTLDAALALSAPNARVLQLDRHQPEFTLTWSQYRSRTVTPTRLQQARANYDENLSLLTAIWQRYGVDPRILIGIWGLESNFGTRAGTFQVVDALSTLAFDGRRASFFRSELMNALRILDHGDVTPAGMLGSYAGAMGQPQFMPSSYLRFAVDWSGNGRRDIWTDRADVLASIANYLSRSGWRRGEPWGQEVRLTAPIDPARTGRGNPRPLGDWEAAGVRRDDGGGFSRADVSGSLLLPDGAGGAAFMVYPNFNVIRRYNPSDFYSLAVGLIGNGAA
ncbi:lytic murein transglycosylase [Rhizosaccharibacter radicis]|uniref:Lytic murein transglycosylase n=1 Tax=Rhizosaccharibacter radicis TaxID=2782605 RepID=A0ABT1W0U9_9PROT|nr:lytic murein transglycosylase [Acetobacteraceae bacterium KSS12]